MDFDLLWTESAVGPLADWERDLVADLKMDVLLREMAQGDARLYEECERILARVCTRREAILKRQAVLRDALDSPETFENLYRTAAEALAQAEKIGASDSPRYDKTIPVSQRIVTQAHMAEVFLHGLKEIGGILGSRGFQSEGMRRLQASK